MDKSLLPQSPCPFSSSIAPLVPSPTHTFFFFPFFPSRFHFSPTRASLSTHPDSQTHLRTSWQLWLLCFSLSFWVPLSPWTSACCCLPSIFVIPFTQSQNFLKPSSAFTSLFAVCHHCLTWSLGLNNYISFPSFQIQSLLNQLVFTTKDTSCHLFLHFLLQDHFPHLNCDYSSTYTLFGHQQRSLFAFVLNVLQ